MEIVPNLRPIVFWLKVRTRGPQPSICVPTFSQFTSAGADGNCAEGSTESASMIDFCAESSKQPWVTWLVPLLERRFRCERWKSVPPLVH